MVRMVADDLRRLLARRRVRRDLACLGALRASAAEHAAAVVRRILDQVRVAR